MKIRMKIQLFTTVWLILLLVAVNTGVYLVFANRTTGAEINRLVEQTQNMVEAVKIDPESPFSPADLLRTNLPVNGMIRVINEAGEVILIVTKRTELADLPAVYRQGQSKNTLKRSDGEKIAIIQHPFIWADGSVVSLEVSESLSLIQENIKQLQFVLFLSTLAVLLPVIIGGRLLSRLILRPIQAMIRTMEDIQSEGTFKKIELKQRSRDELTQMATTFNRMIDLLKQNFEKQQQFVSDASHELRTPLTIIESYASLLRRWGANKPEIREEAIDAIHTEAQRMKIMTEQMLRLAKDDAVGEIDLHPVELVHFCHQVSKPLINTYHREISVSSEADAIYALADEQKLKQILFIILDNAFKYSEHNISLHIGTKLSTPYIRIEDKGIGIPADELEQVFDRFYRVDKARHRETGGTGLGLSIAQKLAHALQGSIQLESEEGVGTAVTLFLQSGDKK